MPKTLQPRSEAELIPGPSVTPAEALLAWLEASAGEGGRDVLLRLPVVLRFRSDRLGLAGAHIGVLPGAAPADAIQLNLDDTALGIGLWEQVRERCDLEQDSCVVWLEGTWGSLVDLPSLPGASSDPGTHPFTVRAVGGPVPPGTTTVFRAK